MSFSNQYSRDRAFQEQHRELVEYDVHQRCCMPSYYSRVRCFLGQEGDLSSEQVVDPATDVASCKKWLRSSFCEFAISIDVTFVGQTKAWSTDVTPSANEGGSYVPRDSRAKQLNTENVT